MRRTPPPDYFPEDRRAWREEFKNRNRHSCKLPDELEVSFQSFRTSRGLTKNAAIVLLLSTHPDLQNND